MSLLPDFTAQTATCTVALVRGGVVRHRGLEPARAVLETFVTATAKKTSQRQFAAIEAGPDLLGAGYVLARAPVAFADPVRLPFAKGVVRSATLDAAGGSVGDRDARTAMDLVQELVTAGHERVAATAMEGAPPLDEGIDEPELHLVGDGALVWGRLLPNDGADYEKGRVRTFRPRIDGDVVRVVGVVLAEASPGTPVRIGYDVDGSIREWAAEATEALRAELEPSDVRLWLVAR